MKIIFSKEAEKFLEKKSAKSNVKLNLVLHAKEICKSCYSKMEPDVTFETDENYLEGIDKIGDWKGKIDIYKDPAINPLIQNKEEIHISLKGKLGKTLSVDDGLFQVQLKYV